MKKLEIIIRHSRLDAVKTALVDIGIHGMTLTDVKGFGCQGGHKEVYRGTEIWVEFLPKLKIEIVVEKEMVDTIIEAVREAASTGEVGDGKIFVYNVEEVTRIRTGEKGKAAL